MSGKGERKQTPEPLANVVVEHKHHKTHNQPCSPLSANPMLMSSSSSEDDSSEVLPPCAPSQPVLGRRFLPCFLLPCCSGVFPPAETEIRAAGGRNAGSALGRSTVCRWGMGLWPYRVYKELGEGLGEAWGTSGRAESGTGSCGNCSCGYRLGLRHFCSLSEGRQANARSARFWAQVHSDR